MASQIVYEAKKYKYIVPISYRVGAKNLSKIFLIGPIFDQFCFCIKTNSLHSVALKGFLLYIKAKGHKGCDNGQVYYNLHQSLHAAHGFGVVSREEFNNHVSYVIRQSFEGVMNRLDFTTGKSNLTLGRATN